MFRNHTHALATKRIVAAGVGLVIAGLCGAALTAGGCSPLPPPVVAADSQAPDAAPAPPQRIALSGTPASPQEGGFGYRSFTIEVPWMQGTILVRFPEQVRSSIGLHFLDCGSQSLPPLSVPEPFPPWVKDEATGALSYHYTTKEGLEWWAAATPFAEEVSLEFRMRNNRVDVVTEIFLEMCTMLDYTEDFSFRGSFDRVATWFDGVFKEVTETVPPPQGRYLIIHRVGSTFWPSPLGQGQTPDSWTLHRKADLPIIACVTADRGHLVAVSWFDACQVLKSNANLACIHAGPETLVTLGPGEEYCWRGAIYLMSNDPDVLRKRFTDDRNRIEEEERGTLRLIPDENDRFLRVEDPETPQAAFLLWAPEDMTYPDLGAEDIPITWRRNEGTGSVWYTLERDHAVFSALFQPHRNRVTCAYTVQPEAGSSVPGQWQISPCHQLKGELFAGEGEELMRRLWLRANGRWVSVASCAGTRFWNWFELAGDTPPQQPVDPLALPCADIPLIACVSRDGQWVTATSADPCRSIFNNTAVPCIHAHPCGALEPAGPTTLRAVMYLMRGSLDDLLREYQADTASAPSHCQAPPSRPK